MQKKWKILKIHDYRIKNIKHLLDETESNIRFVLPGQVMLGEAKLSLTSLDPAKLI